MRRAPTTALEFSFTAVFEFDQAACGYAATFPAIPTLTARGETLQAAQLAAAAALSRYLERLTRRGSPLPESDYLVGLAWSTRITVRISLDRTRAPQVMVAPADRRLARAWQELVQSAARPAATLPDERRSRP